MVYRKTPAIVAHMEGKRSAMIAAAIHVMQQDGASANLMEGVAKRTKVLNISTGLIYRYFQNAEDLRGAATVHILNADIEAIGYAAEGKQGAAALGAAISAYFGRLRHPHLVRAMFNSPMYWEGIRNELARLAKGVSELPPKERAMAGDAILGALYGLWMCGACSPQLAASYALRGIGLSDSAIRKALERLS